MAEKFEQSVEPLLASKALVKLAVGFLRFLEAAEFYHRFLHGLFYFEYRRWPRQRIAPRLTVGRISEKLSLWLTH